MNKLFLTVLVVFNCYVHGLRETIQKRPIGIIGFPFSKGQRKAGVEVAPIRIREADLGKRLIKLDNRVYDHGDLDLSENQTEDNNTLNQMRNSQSVGDANKKLSDKVQMVLNKNEQVLVLGGDHSMGIGSVHGHCQVEPDLILIWVDAHSDINTPLTSTTGNMHGMSISFLVKELSAYLPEVPSLSWCKPCINASSLVYIGLRDVDPGESKIIELLNIRAYSMHEIDGMGIHKVLKEALTKMDPSGKRPIHLSFDIDSIDPTLTPCTGTPVNGGLTLREAFYIAEEVAKTKRLSVLDIVEFNPKVSACESEANESQVNKTLENTLDVIMKFYGSRRQGNVPLGYCLPVPPTDSTPTTDRITPE